MAAPPLRPFELIQRLIYSGVEFTVIGGVAATFHGIDYTTKDLDVCAPLKIGNLGKIMSALEPLDPRQRMRPDRAPLPKNLADEKQLDHLYVETTFGWIDFLSEVSGVGDYAAAKRQSVVMKMRGMEIQVLALDSLIAAKEAAGRPKDQLSLPLLRALREMDDPERSLFGKPRPPAE